MPDRKFGPPRARPGQIKAQWGKIADHDPDIVYVGGDGTSSADRHLLHGFLTSPKFLPFKLLESDPSFLEELDARGYDITTLKISIEKKAATRKAFR